MVKPETYPTLLGSVNWMLDLWIYSKNVFHDRKSKHLLTEESVSSNDSFIINYVWLFTVWQGDKILRLFKDQKTQPIVDSSAKTIQKKYHCTNWNGKIHPWQQSYRIKIRHRAADISISPLTIIYIHQKMYHLGCLQQKVKLDLHKKRKGLDVRGHYWSKCQSMKINSKQ